MSEEPRRIPGNFVVPSRVCHHSDPVSHREVMPQGVFRTHTHMSPDEDQKDVFYKLPHRKYGLPISVTRDETNLVQERTRN